MADDHGPVDLHRLHEVAGEPRVESGLVVISDKVAIAAAGQIRRQYVIALCQSRHDPAPRQSTLAATVQQDQSRALAGFGGPSGCQISNSQLADGRDAAIEAHRITPRYSASRL